MKTSDSFCPFPWIQYQVESEKERMCCVSDVSSGYSLNKNTEVKKKVRLQMMKGERPSECNYCYDIEDKGGVSLRQRMLSKDGPIYNTHKMSRFTDEDGTITCEPDCLNIWIGNICNLACVTCNPEISSKWLQDKDILSPPIHVEGRWDDTKLHILKLDIWKHIPSKLRLMSENNEVISLHIAGGEPLMDKRSLGIIDFLVESGISKRANLFITTNGMFIDKFMISKFRHFFNTVIALSVDGVGKRNDYIRHGSSFGEIEKIIKLMENNGVNYRFSHTVSAMSVFYFPEFHDWAKGKELALSWVSMPDFMRIESLPQQALDKIANADPLSSYHQPIINYAQSTKNDPIKTEKLKIFLNRNDQKRGVDHRSVFPEICEYLY